MPAYDTPPSSPTLLENDEEDDNQFNEDDMVEVYDLDEDDGSVNAVMDDDEEDEVIPEVDNSKLTFSQHAGVLSCAFHPKSLNMAASGGIDDMAYIWDITDGSVLFSCKGHEDSVEIVAFSYDGSYLATADLNGIIKIWKTGDFSLVCTFELDDELSWLQWHHGVNVLVASSQVGMVYMYKIPSGESKMVVSPFGQTCTSGKILADGKRVVCGYKDGGLKIVDLKQATVLQDIKPIGDLGSVTCLDAHKDNNLVICGCDDGSVILFNSQSGKVASILSRSQSSDGCNYVEAVAFCKDPTLPVAASGSLDGNLIIWDISRQTMRHKLTLPSSVNQLIWHPSLPIVYTCHVEGVARAIDAKAGTTVKEFSGHRKCCLNMALSTDGSLLMTCSEDKTVKIFTVDDK